MKNPIFICLVFLVTSCEYKKPTESSNNIPPLRKNTVEIHSKFDSTIYENIHLFPKNIHLDSITGFDSSSFLQYNIVWPVFEDPKLDFISKICKDSAVIIYNDYLNYFRIDKEDMNDYSPFEMDNTEIQYFPELIHVDDSIFSICWSTYSYSAGAAHGSGIKTCLTLDLNSKKTIHFEDIFAFQTKKDSSDFRTLIESYHPDIELEQEIYPYDFFLKDEFIVFVFEDYEVCAYAMGAPKAIFSKKELQRFLKIK